MRIIVRFEREMRAREKIWILTRERETERVATDEIVQEPTQLCRKIRYYWLYSVSMVLK